MIKVTEFIRIDLVVECRSQPPFLTHPLVLSYSSNLFSSIYECKTQIIVWGVMLMMKGAGQTRNSETKLIHNKTQARHLPTSSRRKWLIQLKTLALGFSNFYFLYFIFFYVLIFFTIGCKYLVWMMNCMLVGALIWFLHCITTMVTMDNWLRPRAEVICSAI